MATQTLKIPNKLSEITLGQYQQFSKISTDDADEDFLQKKTIEIFCGINLIDVVKIKYTSIIRVIGVINKMFSQKSVFTNRFKMNDTEYGFVPKLDDMTYGEFVDLDTLMSDWSTMDQAMAVLFRKVKDTHKTKYTIEEYNQEESQDMKQMPLDVAFGAIFFLESLGKELTNHSLSYLVKKSKSMTEQQKQTLTKSMGGGLHFTPLVKAI